MADKPLKIPERLFSNIVPRVSIIVLNYQGERVIRNCINSLLDLDYPAEKMEIIIVDNNSTDESIEIIKELEKVDSRIQYVRNSKNFGFSKGNNIGIKRSTGEYVVLLNNDCVVDRFWLKTLIGTAISDDNIFSVGSRILFYPKYRQISVAFPMNMTLSSVSLRDSLLNHYAAKDIQVPIHHFSGRYLFEVPFDPDDHDVTLRLRVSSNNETSNDIDQLELPGELLASSYNSQKLQWLIDIRMKANSAQNNKIQNAGIVVFQDGHGRDVGAVVKDGIQVYENDLGQFDNVREVYANCGAAVLYSKRLLAQHGLLCEDYFMYYEDVEICERYRLLGFRNVSCPQSVVRHLHAYSSLEWSEFFNYHVERGRLLHVYQHFPLKVFLVETCKYIAAFVLRLFKNPSNIVIDQYRLRVLFSLIKPLFVSRKSSVTEKNNNYRNILKGIWLLGKETEK